MIVHIKSDYSLRDEDIPLLPSNKLRWWMKSEDNEENPWIKFPSEQLGNNILDVTLDLAPGRYSAGVGDYNVVNDKGWHVSQRLYFYVVPDGTVITTKWADLPSYDEVIAMGDEGYVPEGKGQQSTKTIGCYDENPRKINGIDADKIEKTMTQIVVPYVRFCKFPRTRTLDDTDEIFFLRKIVEIRKSICGDFKEIKPDAGYKCDNCIFAEELYLDEKAVIN